jgi:isopenicillin-N epimerase
MAVAELPALSDVKAFKNQLYQDFKVEIPCTQWDGRQFIRVSIQAYNRQADGQTLLNALESLLPAHTA